MPELPEVETIRAGLQARIAGRILEGIALRRTDLRIPVPRGFVRTLRGRRAGNVDRRGKYLLWHFDGAVVLIAHLGMSGRLVVRDGPPPPPEPHEHAVFSFAGGATVAFRDPRRFGLLTLTTEDDLHRHPLLRALGPEPLGDGFDGPALAAALQGRRAPLKASLLDQRLVAGLGNIYVCEALFRAGLDPARESGTVRGTRAGRLAESVRGVLTEAIAAGGSSLRDYVGASGELGYFQHRFAVYGHEGDPCPACRPRARCRVQRTVQSGRSTFFCPRHQR